MVDTFISDHSAVCCELNLVKPFFVAKKSRYRKIKNINLEAFNGSLASALTSAESCDDVKYNENVTSVLNEYAPEVERTIVIRPLRPWYTSAIGDQNRLMRQFERKWRKFGHKSDYVQFKFEKNNLNNMLSKSKVEYFSNLINNSKGDQKALFQIVKGLMGCKNEIPYPQIDSLECLVNNFNDYFV